MGNSFVPKFHKFVPNTSFALTSFLFFKQSCLYNTHMHAKLLYISRMVMYISSKATVHPNEIVARQRPQLMMMKVKEKLTRLFLQFLAILIVHFDDSKTLAP